MIYCNSCARILDEDVQFCPLCNEEDPNWQEKEPVPDIAGRAFKGDAFDKLRQINQQIEERGEPEPEPAKPFEPPPDTPGVGLYVAMIILSMCFSFVGVIMGIVYLVNRNKNYQLLGILTLVISTVFLVSAIIFFIAILFTVSYYM